MIHAIAGFRENYIVSKSYCFGSGFIPVQFVWLASSSYPLGHTQTNVPVELSQVYPQLKLAAAQKSVTERKEDRHATENNTVCRNFVLHREMYFFLMLFCLSLCFLFILRSVRTL